MSHGLFAIGASLLSVVLFASCKTAGTRGELKDLAVGIEKNGVKATSVLWVADEEAIAVLTDAIREKESGLASNGENAAEGRRGGRSPVICINVCAGFLDLQQLQEYDLKNIQTSCREGGSGWVPASMVRDPRIPASFVKKLLSQEVGILGGFDGGMASNDDLAMQIIRRSGERENGFCRENGRAPVREERRTVIINERRVEIEIGRDRPVIRYLFGNALREFMSGEFTGDFAPSCSRFSLHIVPATLREVLGKRVNETIVLQPDEACTASGWPIGELKYNRDADEWNDSSPVVGGSGTIRYSLKFVGTNQILVTGHNSRNNKTRQALMERVN